MHLLDGMRIPLRRVVRLHDQLGLDRLDVRAGILYHPVVAGLDRASPSTAMMELTVTDGATGISCRVRMKWCRGDMLSTAEGMTMLDIAPGLRARSAATGHGERQAQHLLVTLAMMLRPATKLPDGVCR